MRITDKHVFFWGGIFSNWYSSEFDAEYGGETHRFFNSEQYFMFVKAKTFGDEKIAEEILKKGKNPKVAKSLGRKVAKYDDDFWSNIRYKVMVDACFFKFSASSELQKELLHEKYKDKHFVEASPIDCIWGVGLAEDDSLIDDEKNWKGTNLLGKALDAVREMLLKNEK